MYNKAINTIVFLIIFLTFSVVKINAAEPVKQEKGLSQPPTAAAATPSADKGAAISPEKKAIIQELFDVTDTQKMAEDMAKMMLSQVERNYPQILEESGVLKDKKQDELRKLLIESWLRFSKRFGELYPQRINFAQILDQIYLPIYDKYFSENELRDLVAFYKSATGQKAIKVMPQLMQESMQRSSEILLPKMRQLVNDLIQEEKGYFAKAAQQAKPQEAPKVEAPAKAPEKAK